MRPAGDSCPMRARHNSLASQLPPIELQVHRPHSAHSSPSSSPTDAMNRPQTLALALACLLAAAGPTALAARELHQVASATATASASARGSARASASASAGAGGKVGGRVDQCLTGGRPASCAPGSLPISPSAAAAPACLLAVARAGAAPTQPAPGRPAGGRHPGHPRQCRTPADLR